MRGGREATVHGLASEVVVYVINFARIEDVIVFIGFNLERPMLRSRLPSTPAAMARAER